ncbi:MAG: LPD38 domain-containing protein, partial [Candidatus Thorarchaeota archaeon]
MPIDWVGSEEHKQYMTGAGAVPTGEFSEDQLYNPMSRPERVVRQVSTGVRKDLPAGYLDMARMSLTAEGRDEALEMLDAYEGAWPLKGATMKLLKASDTILSPSTGYGYGLNKAVNIAMKSLSDPLHREAEAEFEATLDPVRSDKELFAGHAARLLGSMADVLIPAKGISKARNLLDIAPGAERHVASELASLADDFAEMAPKVDDKLVKELDTRKVKALYDDVNRASDAEAALTSITGRKAEDLADRALEIARQRFNDPFMDTPIDAGLPKELLDVAIKEERGTRLARERGYKGLEEKVVGDTVALRGATRKKAFDILGEDAPQVSEAFNKQMAMARTEEQLYRHLSDKLMRGELVDPQQISILKKLADDVSSTAPHAADTPEGVIAKGVPVINGTDEASEAIAKVKTYYDDPHKTKPLWQQSIIGRWRTLMKNWRSMEDVITRYPKLGEDPLIHRMRLRIRGLTESTTRGIDGMGTSILDESGHTYITGPSVNKTLKPFDFSKAEADDFINVYLTGERVAYDVNARLMVRNEAKRVKASLSRILTQLKNLPEKSTAGKALKKDINKLREELIESTDVEIGGKVISRPGERGITGKGVEGLSRTSQLIARVRRLMLEADEVINYNKVRVEPKVIDEHMAGLEALRQRYGNEGYEKFTKAAEALRATVKRGTLDLLNHAGMISDNAYKNIEVGNQFWAPLARHTDDIGVDPFIIPKAVKKARGPGGVKGQIEQLKVGPGEFTEKVDPFSEMLYRMGRASSWYERQMLANRIVELAKEFPELIPLKKINPKTGKTTFYAGDPELIAYLDGSTAANLRLIKNGLLSKVGMTQSSQIFRTGVTLTTRFILKNLLRDPFQVDLLSRAGARWMEAMFRGMYTAMGSTRGRAEFNAIWESQNLRFGTLARGGTEQGVPAAQRLAMGLETKPQGVLEYMQVYGSKFEEVSRRGVLHKGLHFADPAELEKLGKALKIDVSKLPGQRKLPGFLAAQKAWDKSWKAVNQSVMERFSNLSKNFMDDFVKAREERLTLNEIFEDVREAPLDFSDMGYKAAVVNSFRPFFNAAVRDLDKILRVAKEQPIVFFGRMMTNMVIPSAILYAMHKDDPDYQNEPAFSRAMNWYIDKRKDGTWLKLPKPHLLGLLASYVGEEAVNAFTDAGGDRDWGIREMVQQLPFGEAIATMTMPRGEQDDVSTRMADAAVQAGPYLFQPLYEVGANRDLFRGSKTVSETMERKPVEMRFRENTPLALREMSMAMSELGPEYPNMAPVNMHHLIRGYTGYLGEEVTKAADYPIRM